MSLFVLQPSCILNLIYNVIYINRNLIKGVFHRRIYVPKFYIFYIYNFFLKHEEPGVLSMANTGKSNTNNSQFFITTAPCLHLDGKNVVFGKVKKGLSVVQTISVTNTNNDVPIDVSKMKISI